LAVTGRGLPGQAAVFRDHRQMAITLCRRTRLAAQDGRRAGRDHYLDLIAVRGDRLVGGRAIIRAIGPVLGSNHTSRKCERIAKLFDTNIL